MEYYKASDIIPIFIKFSRMTKKEDWNEKALKDNEPRLYRFQQIQALLKAFNVKGGVGSLMEGDFYKEKSWVKQMLYIKDLHENKFILSEYNRLAQINEFQSIEQELSYIWLIWHYFLRLAFQFNSLMDINDVKQGGFIGEMCMDVKRHFTSGSNKEQIDKVFRLLGILLDPFEREISKELLVKKYKFPDVNIDEVDAEYN